MKSFLDNDIVRQQQVVQQLAYQRTNAKKCKGTSSNKLNFSNFLMRLILSFTRHYKKYTFILSTYRIGLGGRLFVYVIVGVNAYLNSLAEFYRITITIIYIKQVRICLLKRSSVMNLLITMKPLFLTSSILVVIS